MDVDTRAQLVMALHFHQPVGNFDQVLKRAYTLCYLPLLETLRSYPEIKWTFHFSGPLLDWIEMNHPEYIAMLKHMVDARQVEMLAGPYYEPIVPVIPARDAHGQIAMMKEYIKTRFQQDAEGMWLPERVWEPHLPSLLHGAGIQYLIVDDIHLVRAGIPEEKIRGYFITEDCGKKIGIFASLKELRYGIPFRNPSDLMGWMRYGAEGKPSCLFFYGDDAEKFGEWPKTHEHVYTHRWLESFLNSIMENRQWLISRTMSEYFHSAAPLGNVYMNVGSYMEMSDWVQGGMWRNFFVKYAESNHMNKKMLYVSNKFEKLSGTKYSEQREAIRPLLYKGQCNCAYWHGVFGGVYLHHLRQAIYENLIKAETRIDEILRKGRLPLLIEIDFNADGKNEFIMEHQALSMVVEPHHGGMITELDSRLHTHNFLNTFTRYQEHYHQNIRKKMALQEQRHTDVATIHDGVQTVDARIQDFYYDTYRRGALVDHFFAEDTSEHTFFQMRHTEYTSPQTDEYKVLSRAKPKGSLVLQRTQALPNGRVIVEKKIILKEKGFLVEYILTHQENNNIPFWFAVEYNITLPSGNSSQYVFKGEGCPDTFGTDMTRELKEIKVLQITDAKKQIDLRWQSSQVAQVWAFPLETISQSERAFELNYQQSVVVFHWRHCLEAGKPWKVLLEFTCG